MRRHPFTLKILACLIALLAIGLRLALIGNAPQFDEIWSMQLTTHMKRALDIFQLHIDNNHYLNTLWLYIVGLNQPFWIYHIPSFLAGVGLVIAVLLHGWKQEPTKRLLLALITACSQLLLLYGSQARGFVPMLFFGYLAFIAMERLIEKKRLQDALLFALLSMVAFLWQLTFIHLYLALAVWSLAALLKKHGDRGKILLITAHLPVAIMLYLLAITDFSHFVLGGALFKSPAYLAHSTLDMLFATPQNMLLELLLGIALIFIAVIKIDTLWNKDRPRALFLITLFLLSPIAWLILFHPPFLYPRYFFPSLFFVLLIVGDWFAAMLSKKQLWMKWLGGILLSGYVLLQLISFPSLLYTADEFLIPLKTAAASSGKAVTLISSDPDFRIRLETWFWTPKLADENIHLTYSDSPTAAQTADAWLRDRYYQTAPSVLHIGNATYTVLPEKMPVATDWVVYGKVASPSKKSVE